MSTFRFEPVDNVDQVMRESESIGPALRKATRDARDVARRTFPIDRNEQRRKSVVALRPRLVVHDGVRTIATFLANYDRVAVLIEFGSRNNPPYRPLSTGIESVGFDRVDWTPAPGKVSLEVLKVFPARKVRDSSGRFLKGGGYE